MACCNWIVGGTHETVLEIKHECGDVKVVVNGVEHKPVKQPPKQYDFAEAYVMMKAGKWMRCGETGTPQRFDGEHLVLGFSANKYSRNTSTFSPREIESQWQEVNP